MNKFHFSFARAFCCASVVSTLVVLSACQTQPSKSDEAAAAASAAAAKAANALPMVKEEPPPVDPAQLVLQNGIDLYNRGEFAASYKLLQDSPEINAAAPPIRVEAFKYLAFSSCAQNKRTSCKQAFDKLLTLQSDYELKDAEAKHPVWGPIFKQVKSAHMRRIKSIRK